MIKRPRIVIEIPEAAEGSGSAAGVLANALPVLMHGEVAMGPRQEIVAVLIVGPDGMVNEQVVVLVTMLLRNAAAYYEGLV